MQKGIDMMRLFFFLFPLYLLGQFSTLREGELKIIDPDLGKLIQNSDVQINPLLVELNKSTFLVDQLGGGVFLYSDSVIKQIDNSYQHRMQLGSNIFTKNDTLFRHGGYGFWETRNLLTFFDLNSNEWDVVNSKNKGPEKYSHLSVSNEVKSFFFGGFFNDESLRISHKKSYSSFLFDYKSREWINKGQSIYHFSSDDKVIDIGTTEKLIFRNDTLFFVSPFKNKIELFKSNSFLNTVISNPKLKSYYRDSIFYFINKIHSKNTYEFNSRSFSEVLSNKIGETEFIKSNQFNYWYFLLILPLGFFLLHTHQKKTKSYTKILFLYNEKVKYRSKYISLTKDEIILLNAFISNQQTINKDLLNLLDKKELNYNHQLRILNKTVKDLNNKLIIFLELNDPLIKISKSDFDKRVRVFTLNETVSIEKN